ncbi:MAG: polysaccharide biosynthesis protein [Clostridiales bacterium]|nr:polysaccharide biosynthesis protein [Clostridiales bacterium]
MAIDSQKYNGLFRKIIMMLIDIALFFFMDVMVCFFVYGESVLESAYSPILFNYVHLIVTSVLIVLINYLFRLYKSVWTFAGTEEIVSCFLAGIVDTAVLFAVDRILFKYVLKQSGGIPFYGYILAAFLTVVFLCVPRTGYRVLRREFHKGTRSIKLHKNSRGVKRVMIIGAGYMGNTIIDDIINNQESKRIPVVAVDDNPAKRGKRINSVKIAGNCTEIPELVDKYDVDEIILCLPSASVARQNEIMQIALSTGRTVKKSPSIADFLEDGNASVKHIRNVDITDLLARDEVTLDIQVCRYLIGQTILVTGGGASIGSEICMQCARYKPKTIVIFDIYENCAFELQNELLQKYGDKINIYVRIGSVRDTERLNEVFEEFHPDVVFHAAAHKHVPLMEDSPCEAVKNNIFGTYNVAITADKFNVPKMVILSTDKAVSPTNVMGATKRVTEIIVQYMNEVSKNTKYAAVRFGNVLGSHGSVIPIFKKQIEQGGPVCVTHPDITRYFMTIPEAAQLVCQAGGLANGGEIFVLDMGEPVKIMDLAENLIKLSGFTVEEIGIKITGLRPGEKLYEELALESEMETRSKTANEKIYVNQPAKIDPVKFEKSLTMLKNINNDNVREVLQEIVPNYHPSEN